MSACSVMTQGQERGVHNMKKHVPMNEAEGEFMRAATELLVLNGAGAELLGCFGLSKSALDPDGPSGLPSHGYLT